MEWVPFLCKKLIYKTFNDRNNKNLDELDEKKVIWIKLPYLGERGDQIKKFLESETMFK